MTQTDTSPTGQFTFDGVASGDWQIQPKKVGDSGVSMSALDAVYALQGAIGLRSLTPEQRLACDVSGNGIVSALDAVLMLQYQIGLIARFPAAQTCGSDWAFMPDPAATTNQQVMEPTLASGTCQNGAIAFHPLMAEATNQDFSGILFGDCNGSWQPSSGGGAAALSTQAPSSKVRIGRRLRRHGSIRVPLGVHTSGGFHALNVHIRYDQTQLATPHVRTVGDARGALVVSNSATPGLLVVAVASSRTLGSGPVLMLEFEAKQDSAARAPIRILHSTVEN